MTAIVLLPIVVAIIFVITPLLTRFVCKKKEKKTPWFLDMPDPVIIIAGTFVVTTIILINCMGITIIV